MRSSDEAMNQPGHPRTEHVSMDSPPPYNMFTNVEESQYVKPHGPIVEVKILCVGFQLFFF